MNEHDEYWQEVFASLSEESVDEKKPRKKNKRASTLFWILYAYVLFLVVDAIVVIVNTGSFSYEWIPTFMLHGFLSLAGFFILFACFYNLE